MKCVSCPHCSANAPLYIQPKDYNRHITSETFDYYRCEKCGLIFVDPVPSDIGRFYPRDYYAIPRDRAELRKLAQQWQQWKIDLVLRYKNAGRLLEIGPAYGLFASLAKDEKFDVTVIEMDPQCCKFLRDVVDLKVVESADTLTALGGLQKFDIITVWQVIEHLKRPWEVLKAAAEHLAPGGVLILDTPNPAAFQFGVLGKFWTHVDAPRHLTLIPSGLLLQQAKETGLTCMLLTAADVSANGFNGFGWAETMKNAVGNNIVGKFVHLCGRVLAKILIPVERTGFRGSTYTAVFRKELP